MKVDEDINAIEKYNSIESIYGYVRNSEALSLEYAKKLLDELG